MNLHDLCRLTAINAPGVQDVPVASVTEDSRRVKPGTVFAALPGEHVDGHDFVQAAADNGAIAIIGSRPGLETMAEIPYLYAENPRVAEGIACHALAGDPTKDMNVIGVTGTNGKSSSVVMIQHLLNSVGKSTACLGTLGYSVGGENLPALHTTPFAEDLAQLFKQARDAGQQYAVMEASSHAIEQERIAGIHYNVAAFTNLTQDHLDYHKDMDTYRAIKVRLFEGIQAKNGFTVVNVDDPSASAFVDASSVPCHTYGVNGDCRAMDPEFGLRETSFKVTSPWGDAAVRMKLIGAHNVSNAMCAMTVVCGLGVPIRDVAEALSSLDNVPGRFECVDEGQEFAVVVDYAHTDDGLRNVLQTAQAICTKRVICVFGCGGDRDRGKRPKMAAVAAELADFSIITSDNPRTEDPQQILNDVEAGAIGAGQRIDSDYELMGDREQAIRRGIELAAPGDLVMIAGKGHEDYQILGTEKIHFDDREIARQILAERI
jgi:UDP-N-acetylmuramoyl-L-alanyl-D-glutamate--2,6-diaminopimelate ligase